jgi:sodium-dependent dicarboxylate transporter 2/3/5
MSAAVLVAAFFLPVPAGLADKGLITIGLLLFFLIMLITEALPVGVICFLCLALLPTLGITKNLTAGLSGFTNYILFFVLASFGLAEVVTSTPIVQRILHALIKKFGKDVKTSVLAIMVAAAIVSAVITDVPTVVVFMGIGASFLNMFKNETDRNQTAKSLMIGIPIAVMLGGLTTPAGSGINIMTIGLLQNLTGIRITFIQWMVYPPAEIETAEIKNYLTTIAVNEKMGRTEVIAVTIGSGMMFLWLLSSFVPIIEVTVVALFGCVCFFLPGIKVLTWETYMKAVSWTSFILIGTVICIANTIVDNGVSAWFVNEVLPTSMSVTTMEGVFFVAVMTFIIMLIVPVAPALIAVLTPVIVSLAATTGINPALLIITLGLCAGNCYLFPIDTIPLITYTAGYYKMTDMPKATVWIQLAFISLATLWLPIAGQLVSVL